MAFFYAFYFPDAWIDVEDAGIDWSDFGEEKICYSTIDGIHYGVPYFNNMPIYAKIVDMSSHIPVVEQNQYHYKCREYVSKVVYDISKKNISVKKALQAAEENLQYDMEQ